ncbi:hypothetical protein HZ326_29344 [Fusarium oxysporum f. sp. albedinis]|nr:hypothetical protein HZ326_29344 [Fusarium oxysporum f. sp. albedinis]
MVQVMGQQQVVSIRHSNSVSYIVCILKLRCSEPLLEVFCQNTWAPLTTPTSNPPKSTGVLLVEWTVESTSGSTTWIGWSGFQPWC